MKKNLKFTVSYDGKKYFGWQTQSTKKTVQETIEKAISKAINIEVELVKIDASGRTDSGVHARGQVFSTHLPIKMPPEKFKLVLNRILPSDISIECIEEVSDDFHARYCAKSKTYSYSIYTGTRKDPFLGDYAWHVPHRICLKRMREACECLLGEHDFRSFMASGSGKTNTIRTIYEIAIKEDKCNDIIEITYIGSGFLYNMVRIMTALLIEVGQGRKSKEDVVRILNEKDRTFVPYTAPAQGLYLERVDYE
jgi:tRNA pseudouridine38-40 synthase